jgi:hypothetical protein
MSKIDNFYGNTPARHAQKPLYDFYGSNDDTLKFRLVIRENRNDPEFPILRYFKSDGLAHQAMNQLKNTYRVAKQYQMADGTWRG